MKRHILSSVCGRLACLALALALYAIGNPGAAIIFAIGALTAPF